MSKLNSYRQDIDGLRAIAVLAVIIFHIEKSWMPGGFAGVDIFFVISGYLITKNIVTDIASQRFSVLEFYRKRIKRIMPALSVVVMSTLIAAQFVYLPKDVENFSFSAIASQLSFANIYFTYFLDTSYFEKNAALEPLLHIWSLGVEEQFYIFWPLALLFFLGRINNSVLFILLLLVILSSFLLGELLLSSNPMFSYYMLPTRAGELLVGALTYFILDKSGCFKSCNPMLLNLTSFFGLLMVIGSLLLLTENSSFPGVNSIPVCVGTGLIILCNGVNSTIVGRALALPPLLVIGLISYSLYLWHWPVFSFVRYIFGDINDQPYMILLSILVMLTLSVLSYRFVEIPSRNSKATFSKVFKRQFAIPSFIVLIIASTFISTDGLGVFEANEQYKTELAKSGNIPLHSGRFDFVCSENSKGNNQFALPECIINGEKEPRVLLWGDSTARQYVGMFGENAEKFGFSFRNVSMSSCPPLAKNSGDFIEQRRREQCVEFNNIVVENISRYDFVILSGIWSSYIKRGDSFLTELENTIKYLSNQNKGILLVGQIPTLNVDNECAKKALKLPWLNCRARMSAPRVEVDIVNDKISSIAKKYDLALYMDVNDVLCDQNRCSSYVNNKVAYFDPHHLSMDGSISVGELMIRNDYFSEVFTALSLFRTDEESRIPLPWNRTIEKNPLLSSDQNGIVLIDLKTITWLGDANVHKGIDYAHIHIHDESSDALSSAYFGIGTDHIKDSPDFESMLIEIDIELKNDGFSLFRIKTRENSFDYRLSVSAATQTYYAHDDLKSTDVSVEFNGSRALIKLIVKIKQDQKYSVVIYPSIGLERDKVYPEYIGGMSIKGFSAKLITNN